MVEPRCGDTADERNSSTLMRGGCEDPLPELRQVWSSTLGDPRVCIAVLDGPAELAHPAFDGALVRQVDVSGGAKPARGAGLRHGTHVASLIFGQHDGPVRGVAPKCRGVVIPIYGEQDDGSLVPCSQMDLARAISLAVAVGANVINISAGVYDETGEPEPPLVASDPAVRRPRHPDRCCRRKRRLCVPACPGRLADGAGRRCRGPGWQPAGV